MNSNMENIVHLLRPTSWIDPLGKVDRVHNRLVFRHASLNALRACGPLVLPPVTTSVLSPTPSNCPVNVEELELWWRASTSAGWSWKKIIAQAILVRVIEVADEMDTDDLSPIQTRVLQLFEEQHYSWTVRWEVHDPVFRGYINLMMLDSNVEGLCLPHWAAATIEWLDFYYLWAWTPGAESIKTLDPGLIFNGYFLNCNLVWGVRLSYAISPHNGIVECSFDTKFRCHLAVVFSNLDYYYHIIKTHNMPLTFQ